MNRKYCLIAGAASREVSGQFAPYCALPACLPVCLPACLTFWLTGSSSGDGSSPTNPALSCRFLLDKFPLVVSDPSGTVTQAVYFLRPNNTGAVFSTICDHATSGISAFLHKQINICAQRKCYLNMWIDLLKIDFMCIFVALTPLQEEASRSW